MSHIVFLLGSYYPGFSAVGYCAYQVQKRLVKDVDVTVIAFRNEDVQSLDEIHEGARILRVETPAMKQITALKRSNNSLLTKTQLIFLRAKGALRRLISLETVDRPLVTAYLEALEVITPEPKAIVACVFPIESVIAALEYKKANPDVLVIPYIFDDYVDSGSLHVLKVAREIKRSRHIRLERSVLNRSDAILAMHPLRLHLESNMDKAILKKVTYLEHPLLSKPKASVTQGDGEVIRLCFTGSLIRGVREPGYLLDLLKAIQLKMLVKADFYTMGNAAGIVKSEVLENSVEIINHGRVSKAEADAAVANADILLNIGDIQGIQVSSKVFEYMATGKPVIHFSYKENDAVTKILMKYPLGLSLVQVSENVQFNIDAINTFITKYYSIRLSFEEVRSIYPDADPRYTADVIANIVDHGKK